MLILSCQILFDSFYCRFLDELVKVGLVCQDGIVIHGINISIIVAFKKN